MAFLPSYPPSLPPSPHKPHQLLPGQLGSQPFLNQETHIIAAAPGSPSFPLSLNSNLLFVLPQTTSYSSIKQRYLQVKISESLAVK